MSAAVITWVSGPVVRARTEATFRVEEAVLVGERELLGEIVYLEEKQVVIQVYEDTTGLRPGDPVKGTLGPLTVALGPGLLGQIFDGLLRPLDAAADFVAPGSRQLPPRRFHFRPELALPARVQPGTCFGRLENAKLAERACRVPPDVSGVVTMIAPAGQYTREDTLCVVETLSGERRLGLAHNWPVRKPRPVQRRLTMKEPLLTGQRVVDTLFPIARGSRAALPGGFGTGKTILQQTLAKWSDADIVVYVGCGERGNEIAEVLQDFPLLEDPRTGQPLLERTVIIANTSNMPVAAREASIYTGVTVAEYYRDQGLHVALMADSTSRWAEALREISGRLGELPSESGYPAYLSSRLAGFYERAGHVQTLGGDEGSVTLIGAVSPPGGDFSEPVTKHTQRFVRCLWALDPERAHARLYPAINPLSSYSADAEILAPWWESQGSAQWADQRRRLLGILDDQARLERMARIVGKDALPPRQQLSLLAAELVTDAFLRQSALSPSDAHCSSERQAAMLALLIRFVDLAVAALERGIDVDRISELGVLRKLQRMGEDIDDESVSKFESLGRALEETFATLQLEDRLAS
jgi:V/A-type H+-transporting ATPase subunit A